jgi:drug/metabolite transporter (DMT)-like permease
VRAGLSRPSSSTLATLGLLLVTVVWGSTFFLIKDVVERMPVPDFLAVRFAIATVVLAALQPGAVRQLSRTGRRRGVVLGATYGIAQIFQTVGLDRTHASVSGFITSMYVVFTPLLAGVFLRHRIGRVAWAAVALSTFGLGVLSLKGFHVGSGEVLTLICAALYAAHIVGLGAWSTPRNAFGLSIVQMAAITVVCAVAAAPDGLTLPPDAAAWAGVVYTAVCAGGAGPCHTDVGTGASRADACGHHHDDGTRFRRRLCGCLGWRVVDPRLVLGGGLVLAAMYLAEVGARRGVDADVPHVSAP